MNKPRPPRSHADRVETVRARILDDWLKNRITDKQYNARLARIDAVAARMLSHGERQDILFEANRVCEYCRNMLADQVDHVIPVCQGGTGDRDNLKAACVLCNADKFGDTPGQWEARRRAAGKRWPPNWWEDWRQQYHDLVALGIDPESVPAGCAEAVIEAARESAGLSRR